MPQPVRAINEDFETINQPDLFRRAQAGCIETRNRLVAANMPLAYEFANRVARMIRRGAGRNRRREDLIDDLAQVGVFALIRCVMRFDPDRGLRFSTMAGRAMFREMQHYIEREFRTFGTRFMQATDVELSDLPTVWRGGMDAERLEWIAARRAKLDQMLAELSPQDRDAMVHRFLNQRPMRELTGEVKTRGGKVIPLSPRNAQKRGERAKARFEAVLNSHGYEPDWSMVALQAEHKRTKID